MLETPQLLSSKIKITVGPRKPESFSQRHVGFYMNYSSFVFRALRRPIFQKFGKSTLLMYAGSRARAALIHELLHLKYETDEKKVRELAKEYFFDFTRIKPSKTPKNLSIYTMVFKVKTDEQLQFFQTGVTVTDSQFSSI